jgi:hypothetical protein
VLLGECRDQVRQVGWLEPHLAVEQSIVVNLAEREQRDLVRVGGLLLFEEEPAIAILTL